MAAATSLRDYQLALSQRLQTAAAGTRVPSKLGLRIAGEAWLVDLMEAGEVIPVPRIHSVPLARPWFKGVANVRGNLYSVTDLAALLGAPPAALSDQARLLLVAERFRAGAAFLVEASVGLRKAEELKIHTGHAPQRWVRAQYADADGKLWKELDVAALIQDEAFLEVSL
ncbi:MAG TPA: chemotaxis protein CheW [Burkholderiales bacterium]|nr:chemotaxis protein CheW [Burkholderiales bacterium]